MGFFDILLKPQPIMEGEKAKANMGSAIKTYVVYAIVIGVILGIFFALAINFLVALAGPLATQNAMLGLFAGLGWFAIIVVPILMIIFMLIGSIIGWGILWIIAKILGGKGSFTETYYLSSRLLWPVFIVGIIVGIISAILGIIPFLGGIVSLLWVLYEIYLVMILLSVANSMSKLRALIVILIPIAIILILSAATFLTLLGSFAMMGANPYPPY